MFEINFTRKYNHIVNQNLFYCEDFAGFPACHTVLKYQQ